MEFVSFIFFAFLGMCLILVCSRSGKLVFHLINSFFDKLESRFM